MFNAINSMYGFGVASGPTDVVLASALPALTELSLVYVPTSDMVYVSYSNKSFTKIDPATNTQVGSVGAQTNGGMYSMVYCSSNGMIYGHNNSPDAWGVKGVIKFDPSTDTQAATLNLSASFGGAGAALYCAANDRLYFSDGSNGTDVFNPATDTLVTNIAAAAYCYGYVYNPTDGFVWATGGFSAASSSVFKINTSSHAVVGYSFSLPSVPNGIEYLPTMDTLVIVSGDTIREINPATGVMTGRTLTPSSGVSVRAAKYNSISGFLFAFLTDGTVAEISPASLAVTRTFSGSASGSPFGSNATCIATSNGGTLFLAADYVVEKFI